jgi:hypothetical protein
MIRVTSLATPLQGPLADSAAVDLAGVGSGVAELVGLEVYSGEEISVRGPVAVQTVGDGA